MTFLLFLLAFLLAVAFIITFFIKQRNRGVYPGLHRHPDNIRRKPIREEGAKILTTGAILAQIKNSYELDEAWER